VRTRYRITAGELRSRITVQEEVRTDDGAGGYTKVWGGTGHEWKAWAEKQYLGGGDTPEMAQDISRRRCAYRTWRRRDVTFTSAMRILDADGTTYAITSVTFDDADRSAQTLVAVELQP